MFKFKPGDKVIYHSGAWMTIISITGNRAKCKFGSIGGYAGSFPLSGLTFWE